MFSRKLKTAGLAVVAAGVFAGSAQAAVIDSDGVALHSTGYDFGGSAWGVGSPLGPGDLHFHHDNGQIRPHLVGTLHLNDADGTCARMRMEYFDDDNRLLRTEYGGEVCVDDDRHHTWSVDLDNYTDNSIDEVQVAVQRESASGWSTRAEAGYLVQTEFDEVRITEDGVDFGGEGFSFGEPTGGYYAGITWNLDNGVVRPGLYGYLHLNNSSGVCARMNLRYLRADGSLLDSTPGGTRCAEDNGHHVWRVDLEPFSSAQVDAVTVQLQTQGTNGSWNTAGADTVSIAE